MSKWRAFGAAALMMTMILLGGCAGHRAFEAGENLVRQGRYDAAVTYYSQAVAANPDSQEYRMKLFGARHQAALQHLQQGRRLLAQGEVEAAAFQFRQARSLEPGLEIANQELAGIENRLRARALVDEARQLYRAQKYPQAQNALQQALLLEPDLSKARELAARVKEERRTLLDGFELDVTSDEPITLKFRDADVREVFNILSRLSGINFIFDEDIRQQKISVFLEKASFPQALELLLKMNGLGKKVLNPKTVIIYPKTMQKEKQYEDQIIQTFYLSNIDAKKAVNLLRTMLQLRKIYVHDELNALVIRDNPEVIKLAQQILEAADRADAEVVFDLELVEVTHRDDLDLGPRLNTYSVGVGFAKNGNLVSSGLDGSNLITGFSGLDTVYTLPSATFDLAKSLADSEILANPKIRVRNREKSSVHVGEREPVITVTTTGETTTDNIQYVDVGVKLKVEPVIQLDGTIVTKLDLEVSSVTERTTTASGSVALRISTTNAQTALTLQDGERTVIGGLIRDDTAQTEITFPLIGKIPLIGPLLTHYENRDRKREILLSITPHIVRNLHLPRPDVASIWSGGEDDLKAGPSFGSFAFEPVTEARPLPTVPSLAPQGADESGDPSPLVFPPAPGPSEPEVSAPPPAGQLPVAPVPGQARRELSPRPSSPEGDLLPPNETLWGQGGTAPPAASIPSTGAPSPLAAGTQGDAQDEPRAFFTGSDQVAIGEEFAIDVTVENIQNLYSAPLFVNYNPAVLEFVRAEEGNFLSAGGAATVFSTSVDSQQGRLIIGYKQGVGGSGASGDGILFRLVFRGGETGISDLSLDRLNFRDTSGNRLRVSRSGTNVEVR